MDSGVLTGCRPNRLPKFAASVGGAPRSPNQISQSMPAVAGSFTTRPTLLVRTHGARAVPICGACRSRPLRNRVVLFVDGNFFTDRSASNLLRPSEFDLVMRLALRYEDIELALIHERDMPLDRGELCNDMSRCNCATNSNGRKRPVQPGNNSRSIDNRPFSPVIGHATMPGMAGRPF
jgi:hypothetical protein